MDALHRGPELSEISSSISAISPTGRTALIMPVLSEKDLLSAHLQRLSKQTTQDFDVVIVHSDVIAPSSLKTDGRFGLVLIKEKGPMGPPGAFYAGQRYALENGYEAVIQCDVDCLPVSDGLVERLADAVSADKGSVFLPGVSSLDGDNPVINWYGAMHRSVLKKSGLVYLPFYYGAEDLEYSKRLRSIGVEAKQLPDVLVDHEVSKNLPLGKTMARLLYHLRNCSAISYTHPEIFRFILPSLGVFAYCDSRFGSRLAMGAALMGSVLSSKLSREERFESVHFMEYPEDSLDDALSCPHKTRAILVSEHLDKGKSERFLSAARRKNVPCKIISRYSPSFVLDLAMAPLGSERVIMAMNAVPLFNPFSLLAKDLYFYDGNKVHALSKGKGMPARMMGFTISMAAYVFMVASYLAVSSLAWIRLRKAFKGYGVRG